VNQKRFLDRDLVIDQMSLSKTDGCRVKSIYEAYPIVLELTRRIDDTNIQHDQARRKLKELVDFKVVLTNPLEDQIPLFYSEEKVSFDAYFEKQFIEADGLFGKAFRENSQLDSVIGHLVEVLNSNEKQYATRRAILVVPHKTESGKNLSPLGLVSVRIGPRFINDRAVLNFSFTWRTVEVLVGFPYSIYGSVQFAKYVTEKIVGQLKPEIAKKTSLGFISYIAHSLHIFEDSFTQKIARRIVDDSSK
jgi:hypothetical protein